MTIALQDACGVMIGKVRNFGRILLVNITEADLHTRTDCGH